MKNHFNKLIFSLLILFMFNTHAQEAVYNEHIQKIDSHYEEMTQLVDSLGFSKLHVLLSDEVKEVGEMTEEQYYKQLALLQVMLERDKNSFILSEHLLQTNYSDYINQRNELKDMRNKIGQISSSSEYILYGKIHRCPTPKRCENVVDNLKRKKCLNTDLGNFIATNFDTQKAGKKLEKHERFEKGKSSGFVTRIYVSFVIDEKGKVVDVEGFSEHPELIKMCEKLVKGLPKLIPGEVKGGEKIRTQYNLPIVYQIQ